MGQGSCQRIHSEISGYSCEQFSSNSLYKLFYIPERASSISNQILSELIRYCIRIAYKTKAFVLPGYMGWVSKSPLSIYFAARDTIDSSVLSYCDEGTKRRIIKPINQFYLTISPLFPAISAAEFFIILLRCSSVLLSLFAEIEITPDCIFVTENKIIADILNNSGCNLTSVSGKDAASLADSVLKSTNDGIAIINASECSEKEMPSLCVKLNQDLLRMGHQSHLPVHIPVVLTDSHSASLNNNYCPIIIDDSEIGSSINEFKDMIATLEYRIIDYFHKNYIESKSTLNKLVIKINHVTRNNADTRIKMFVILSVVISFLSENAKMISVPETFTVPYLRSLLSKTPSSLETLEQIADEFADRLNSLITKKC